jgi:hypothetical protein
MQELKTTRLQHTRPYREYDERDANPKPSRERTDDAANCEGRGNPQTRNANMYEASEIIPTQRVSRRDISGETENQAAGGEADGKSASL